MAIHGIINLDKPRGLTSQQAVTKVKRIFGARKAGHTGTLDPLATGVLLVCLNEATKIASFLTGMDKSYLAKVKLGERTDTYDAEGRVVERRDSSHVTEGMLRSVLESFSGKIRQLPPMYSAVKVGGEPLYRLARKGILTERPEREVDIAEISLTGADFPFFDFTVSCSKGTYVRTLCDDLGMKLGTGAHLVSLVRTRVGEFNIRNSVSLEALQSDETLAQLNRIERKSDAPGLASGRHELIDYLSQKGYFVSAGRALSFLEEVMLPDGDAEKLKQGQQIFSPVYGQEESFVRLADEGGNFFGIGIRTEGKIRMTRGLNL